MTIQEFAAVHRCRVTTDACGDQVIVGKRGRIYEYGMGFFAAMYLGLPNHSGGWRKFKALLRPLSGKPLQDGDCEGTILFDPEHQVAAKLALKWLRCKRKRQLTPEQRAAAAGRLAKMRKSKEDAKWQMGSR